MAAKYPPQHQMTGRIQKKVTGGKGMAYVTVLLAMCFAFLIALFAVQNSVTVDVNFMTWNVQASLVLVVLGSAALGFLLAMSLLFYSQIRLRYQLYKARDTIKQLEEALAARPPDDGKAAVTVQTDNGKAVQPSGSQE